MASEKRIRRPIHRHRTSNFHSGDDRPLAIESWTSGYCLKCHAIYKWHRYQGKGSKRFDRKDVRCPKCEGKLGPMGKQCVRALEATCGLRGIAELVVMDGDRHAKPEFI